MSSHRFIQNTSGVKKSVNLANITAEQQNAWTKDFSILKLGHNNLELDNQAVYEKQHEKILHFFMHVAKYIKEIHIDKFSTLLFCKCLILAPTVRHYIFNEVVVAEPTATTTNLEDVPNLPPNTNIILGYPDTTYNYNFNRPTSNFTLKFVNFLSKKNCTLLIAPYLHLDTHSELDYMLNLGLPTQILLFLMNARNDLFVLVNVIWAGGIYNNFFTHVTLISMSVKTVEKYINQLHMLNEIKRLDDFEITFEHDDCSRPFQLVLPKSGLHLRYVCAYVHNFRLDVNSIANFLIANANNIDSNFHLSVTGPIINLQQVIDHIPDTVVIYGLNINGFCCNITLPRHIGSGVLSALTTHPLAHLVISPQTFLETLNICHRHMKYKNLKRLRTLRIAGAPISKRTLNNILDQTTNCLRCIIIDNLLTHSAIQELQAWLQKRTKAGVQIKKIMTSVRKNPQRKCNVVDKKK